MTNLYFLLIFYSDDNIFLTTLKTKKQIFKILFKLNLFEITIEVNQDKLERSSLRQSS